MAHLYQEAEKKIKEVFWDGIHDKQCSLNIPEIVAQKLRADDNAKDPAYYGHQPGVVHVSYLSRCLRGVILEMLGAKRDEEQEARVLGVFKAGNLFEHFIIDALGNRVMYKQREYQFRFKNITVVGRSDYTLMDDKTVRVGENKSVHSDSFWHRKNEGTLVAYHNQIQLLTYLWLERVGDPYQCVSCKKIIVANFVPTCRDCKTPIGSPSTSEELVTCHPAPEHKLVDPQGMFSYISKDDCTIASCPIRFNQDIVDSVVLPALAVLDEGYATKNPNVAPLPPLAVYNESRSQYEKNWLCKYCGFHNQCAGISWVAEATNLVTTRNRELKQAMNNPHATKKDKPIISVTK